jgi:creatinine amidohydrolase
MNDVRITHLHPRELRERRDAYPVAWLPLGTIEWHGRHLPLGLDGVKAEALCVYAARRLGGVVFPAQYYGDHRGIIVEATYAPDVLEYEATFNHYEECCEELGVSAAGVGANAARDHARMAGRDHVVLLERAFWMIRAYGFTRIAAVAGHYPNVSAADVAVARFHNRQVGCRVIYGHEGILGDGGRDHAGAYETSQLMYLHPDLVRTERLAEDRPDEPTGVAGEHPRIASAERGRAIVDAFVAGCQTRLGDIPAPGVLQDPDEDGTAGNWADVLRGRGNELLETAWS